MMVMMVFSRRFVACIGLVVVLAAALAPSGCGLLWAVLVPLLLLAAAVVLLEAGRRPEIPSLPSSPFLSVSGSRAPPALTLS
jgi:hypothetical protein